MPETEKMRLLWLLILAFSLSLCGCEGVLFLAFHDREDEDETFVPGPTIYVDGTNGDNGNDGLDWSTAVRTIQLGINLASQGSIVLVADGTYTGTGNKDLDFNGKAIHLQSEGGAQNCIIDCESAGRGFYFHCNEKELSIVQGLTIQNGIATWGSGIFFAGSGGICTATVRDCIIKDCVSSCGGAIYGNRFNGAIISCILTNNTGGNDGGGIGVGQYSNPTIASCIIRDNTAISGGGILVGDACKPVIINCLISGNSTSDDGGGIYTRYCEAPTIVNCTIADNHADVDGGGIYAHQADFTLSNTIVWGNTCSDSGAQIHTEDVTTVVTLDHCDYANGANDVAGVGTVTPTDCINDNPQFVDAAGGNYWLLGTSPCVDAGSNALVPSGIATDLDGNARIVNGIVDMGAYEYQP